MAALAIVGMLALAAKPTPTAAAAEGMTGRALLVALNAAMSIKVPPTDAERQKLANEVKLGLWKDDSPQSRRNRIIAGVDPDPDAAALEVRKAAAQQAEDYIVREALKAEAEGLICHFSDELLPGKKFLAKQDVWQRLKASSLDVLDRDAARQVVDALRLSPVFTCP